ncbi:hypothetical protein [Asanoa sp. NPDC050611]|uniref:hypothetical protein n=1 Tax=Asanoa sp. NPDC050611 TaxID=3157098 RepID=UPI0033D08831
MQKRSKRVVAATLAAMGVIAIGGVAYAFFESSTATANGSSADMAPLTVGTEANAPSLDFAGNETKLWPNVGGNHVAQALVHVTNTNEVSVRVTAADITGAVQFAAGTPAECVGKIKVTPTIALDGGDHVIGAGGTDVLRLTGVTLDEDAPNTCQAAQFTTTWTVKATAQ